MPLFYWSQKWILKYPLLTLVHATILSMRPKRIKPDKGTKVSVLIFQQNTLLAIVEQQLMTPQNIQRSNNSVVSRRWKQMLHSGFSLSRAAFKWAFQDLGHHRLEAWPPKGLQGSGSNVSSWAHPPMLTFTSHSNLSPGQKHLSQGQEGAFANFEAGSSYQDSNDPPCPETAWHNKDVLSDSWLILVTQTLYSHILMLA